MSMLCFTTKNKKVLHKVLKSIFNSFYFVPYDNGFGEFILGLSKFLENKFSYWTLGIIPNAKFFFYWIYLRAKLIE